MFKVGEKVVYKCSGVYEIEAIETPSFAENTKKKYFRLYNFFSNMNEKVYVPCDNDGVLRTLSTEEEYIKCIKSVKNMEIIPFTARQPQLLSEHFKAMLSDNTFVSLLCVLKELVMREKECEKIGKKLRQAEVHYLTLTEKAICEELSVSLGIDQEQAREKVRAGIF